MRRTGVSFRSELLLTHAPENTNSEDREPNDALIAENRRKQFDLLTALNEYQMVAWPHLSWETGRLPNVEHGGIPIPLAELLIDPVSLDEQTDAIWFHIEYERFQNVLAKGRSKEMVEMRFGLVDGEAHTLEEVGQHFGVTRERIRQIEQNFLMQIRGRLMFQGADMRFIRGLIMSMKVRNAVCSMDLLKMNTNSLHNSTGFKKTISAKPLSA